MTQAIEFATCARSANKAARVVNTDPLFAPIALMNDSSHVPQARIWLLSGSCGEVEGPSAQMTDAV
ncbi:hypothetical protein U8Q05_12145 [Rhizobium ruizarguesonis]|nr:hypothetical protein U8Q05_12145 [Rhizobium ruizarguesonis]